MPQPCRLEQARFAVDEHLLNLAPSSSKAPAERLRLRKWEQDRLEGSVNFLSGASSTISNQSRSGRSPVAVFQSSGKAVASSAESMTSLNGVPTLSGGSQGSRSFESIETRMAPEMEAARLLEDDGTGVLVAPSGSQSRLVYHCLFHILGCEEELDDIEQWKVHILSHFRTHPPPDTVRCPICRRTFENPCAWDSMLDHIVEVHYQNGQTLVMYRPDFELMRYLYRLKIITQAQFKAIEFLPPGSPTSHQPPAAMRASIGTFDEPLYAPYNRRREQRMREQRRGIGVA
ncbi:hypothetical protein Plec18167_002710 [Paecilomyces lecythidis]|uniref:C2H2-type domain-containing protein n=1 Tax=Paecilomyces lecythidis TaxID=3004212 RepID=A0ABR3Y5X9_9EURO